MPAQGYLTFGKMRKNNKLKSLISIAEVFGYTGKYLTFSLPAGYTCPFAKDCLSKADPATGHITDGPHSLFRCYAASQEARLPNVRRSRHRNNDLLVTAYRASRIDGIYALLRDSLIAAKAFDNRSLIRWHVSGDFFNQSYFDALCLVAAASPSNRYYIYTKALPFVVSAYKRDIVPSNLRITASRGGTRDDLIDLYGMQEAVVVYSEEEADELGLEIDHDDSHAAFGDDSFALLIHGSQPAGSRASAAVAAQNQTKKMIRLMEVA